MQSGLAWHDWIILILAVIGYTFATCKFFLKLRDDVQTVKSDVQNVKNDQIEMKGHVKEFFGRFERVGETLARVDERLQLSPQRGNHADRIARRENGE